MPIIHAPFQAVLLGEVHGYCEHCSDTTALFQPLEEAVLLCGCTDSLINAAVENVENYLSSWSGCIVE
jgi:hypothetical protein